MEKQTLGRSGPQVSRLGLGCMGMSGMYGPANREESIATIHQALESGVRLLDTGDFYGMGHNELLIREALEGRDRGSVVISVKFGALRSPSGAWSGYDARPQAVKNFLAYTLNRLGTDYIDIYRPARVDPAVPIEETIGAIADMVQAGYVRHIGLSEASAETLRKASSIHPICDLQIEYSILSRGIEAEILSVARELGVSITAYGVLSRGLLSGGWSTETAGQRDMRRGLPRFQGANLENNLRLVKALRGIAEQVGCSVAQLSIAWVLSRGNDIVPLIGAREPQKLAEAVGALQVSLSQDDLRQIEAAVPPHAVNGDRYGSAQMAHLDSERNRESL